MTLNGHNAGGTTGDTQRDARLDRLYHEAGGEDPPASLDAAILAAAHREVGAGPRQLSSTLRRWRVPVSIAAVVVLSVSLVNLVQEEEGGRQIEIPPVARQPAAALKAGPSGPAATSDSAPGGQSPQLPTERLQAPVASATAPAETAGERALEPFPQRRMDQQPRAGAAAPSSPPTAAPQPQAGIQGLPELSMKSVPAPSTTTRNEVPAGVRGMAASPPSSPEARGRIAREQESATAAGDAGSATAGRALSAPAAPAFPAAKSAAPNQQEPDGEGGSTYLLQRPIWSDLEQQPPEKWLERIEELRRAGRAAELKDMLTEFRKRFPDHPLPAWAR